MLQFPLGQRQKIVFLTYSKSPISAKIRNTITERVLLQKYKASYCEGFCQIRSAVIGTRRVTVDVVDPRQVESVNQEESNGSSTDVDRTVSARGVPGGKWDLSGAVMEVWSWRIVSLPTPTVCSNKPSSTQPWASLAQLLLSVGCFDEELQVLTRSPYSVAPYWSGCGNCTRWSIRAGKLERLWQRLKQTHLSFLSFLAFHIWLICRSSLYCHT